MQQKRTGSRPRNNRRRGAGRRRLDAATYIIVSSLALNSATNNNHAVVEARSSLRRRATQDSTTHFCGPSWMDARDNCALRQPCPTKSDNECNDPSHLCWGDTFCGPTQDEASLPPHDLSLGDILLEDMITEERNLEVLLQEQAAEKERKARIISNLHKEGLHFQSVILNLERQLEQERAAGMASSL